MEIELNKKDHLVFNFVSSTLTKLANHTKSMLEIFQKQVLADAQLALEASISLQIKKELITKASKIDPKKFFLN